MQGSARPGADSEDPRVAAAIDRYWRANVRVMVVLLATWALAGIGATEEDSDVEPREGSTVEEPVSEAGAARVRMNRILEVLLADGRVEKIDGRPARYVATGGDA